MRRFLVFLLLSVVVTTELVAESRLRKIINWVDSADVAGADTSFIRWPKQGFIAAFNTNFVKSRLVFDYNIPGSAGIQEYNGNVASRLTTLFSVGLSYRGWGLSYSRDFSEHADEEFSFSTYGQTYGAEFHVRTSHSFTGSIELEDHPEQDQIVRSGDIHQRLYSGNVYYVFNHNRFSLPAALSQTVIQRRSAGSWLALISFYRSVMKFDHLDSDKLTTTQFKVGGGYAYNLVFNHERCLFHFSLMPSVMVYYHNHLFKSSEKQPLSQRFSVDGLAHASFVYNFSRYLCGSSLVYDVSWSNMSKDWSVVDLNWSARAFIGVRF